MKNKLLFLLVVVLLIIKTSTTVAEKLFLPVELSIENGDYKDCSIRLTRNGKDAGTISGKKNLRFKLDFNYDYLLAFSKPGYITKKITVNTTVSPEREQQSFEPYMIGVKLFKQYEGINIVVYNQPVAKIRFNPVIDNFDYDVDYTKSILSILEPIEHELEVRAIEERKMIASGELPKEGFEIPEASSERYTRFPTINGGNETISNQNKQQSQSSFPLYPLQDPVDTAILKGGSDINNPALLNNGNDASPANAINNSDDQKNKTLNVKGKNNAQGILNSDGGQDKSKAISGIDNFDVQQKNVNEASFKSSSSNLIINNSGSDISKAKEITQRAGTSKTREFIIEPNRTITTIKINDGQNAVIYRKVLYNWGGLFYFKNISYSISENILSWLKSADN